MALLCMQYCRYSKKRFAIKELKHISSLSIGSLHKLMIKDMLFFFICFFNIVKDTITGLHMKLFYMNLVVTTASMQWFKRFSEVTL